MERERKVKIIGLVSVIVAVIGLTIAFAALSSTLNISSGANLDRVNMDIHFKNIVRTSISPNASTTGTPTPLSGNTAPTIDNINVTLHQPGDYVTYTADIENTGDIDAEIDNIQLTGISAEQEDIFEFTAVYTDNNQPVSVGDYLSHTSPNNVRNITITFKYKDIEDENLIKYVDSFMKNDCFVVVYEYAHGECLFDHWNFNKYRDNNIIETPAYRFKKLSLEKRLNVIEKLFIFFENVIDSKYVTVDFYDSSIIYNFENDEVAFCDIDLFRKMPATNDLGEEYFGTKRLKAPEENELGAIIDERTNEFTLGAIIFDMLSEVKNNEDRYKLGMFIPNSIDDFEFSENLYNVLLKATNYDRNERYQTIKEFHKEFNKVIK